MAPKRAQNKTNNQNQNNSGANNAGGNRNHRGPQGQGNNSQHRPSGQGNNSQQRPQGQGNNSQHRPQGQGSNSQHRPPGQGNNSQHRLPRQSNSSQHRPSGQGNNSQQRPQGQSNSSQHRPPGQGNNSQQRPQGQGNNSQQRPQGQGNNSQHRPQGQGNNSQQRPSGQGSNSQQQSQHRSNENKSNNQRQRVHYKTIYRISMFNRPQPIRRQPQAQQQQYVSGEPQQQQQQYVSSEPQQQQQQQQYASSEPQDRNNTRNQPRIGMKKLEELLEKPPEHIVLAFRDPKFRIEDYLDAPTMGDALVFRLAVVLNKAFECNSIQVMVRNHIDKVLESVFFKTHLYDAVYRFLPHTMVYNLDLIETTIYLCSRFLLLNPLCQGQLGPMKDRLELLVTNRLFNPKLTELFNEMIRLDQDATNRYILRHYNFNV